jgi:serine/threonine protein kinase
MLGAPCRRIQARGSGVGEVFAGRYELVDLLDSGGVGSVWRTWDHREATYLAAKVLRQSDGDSLLRFVRETSRRIDHPHVITPLGWAGEDDRVLFTMPLVRGGSLATLLGDFGALPVGWAAELLRQTLMALEAVHGAGLVHRDVKPGNLLLDATGPGRPHLRLSDFGAAAHVEGPRLTRADSVIGTPGYFAPEQVRGADPDPAQDLYAAGVVALQVLTGRAPSPAGDLPDYRPVTELEHALADLIAELTAADPARRPAGAGQARDRLDRIRGSRDLSAGADPDAPVEVFDHVPDLPAGWDPDGPVAAASRPTARERAEPAATGPVTQVMPVRSGEQPDPGPPAVAQRTPIPLAAWLLAALGVVLIVAAIFLEV